MSQSNTNATTVAKSAVVNGSDINTTDKQSTRNFYASKPNAEGKEIRYAFKRVEERNAWMEKNPNSKILKAIDVYRALHIKRGEAIVASRSNKVMVLKVDKVDVDKGQRILLS